MERIRAERTVEGPVAERQRPVHPLAHEVRSRSHEIPCHPQAEEAAVHAYDRSVGDLARAEVVRQVTRATGDVQDRTSAVPDQRGHGERGQVSRLTEAEGEMDRGLGAGVLGHVQVHRLEGGQALLILEEKPTDSTPCAAEESIARQLIQASLHVGCNPWFAMRIGTRDVGRRSSRTGIRRPARSYEQIGVGRSRVQQSNEGLGVPAVFDQAAESPSRDAATAAKGRDICLHTDHLAGLGNDQNPADDRGFVAAAGATDDPEGDAGLVLHRTQLRSNRAGTERTA